MRTLRIISHAAIGCAGAIGGWLVATGELGIVPSFAQARPHHRASAAPKCSTA